MKIFVYGKVRPDKNPHLKYVEYTKETLNIDQLAPLFKQPGCEVYFETGIVAGTKRHHQGVEQDDIGRYMEIFTGLPLTPRNRWLSLSVGDIVIDTLGDGLFLVYTATAVKPSETSSPVHCFIFDRHDDFRQVDIIITHENHQVSGVKLLCNQWEDKPLILIDYRRTNDQVIAWINQNARGGSVVVNKEDQELADAVSKELRKCLDFPVD